MPHPAALELNCLRDRKGGAYRELVLLEVETEEPFFFTTKSRKPNKME
jgi:hypothetical protein